MTNSSNVGGFSLFKEKNVNTTEAFLLVVWVMITMAATNVGTWNNTITLPQLFIGGVLVMLGGFFSGKSRRASQREQITIAELLSAVIGIALLAGWTGYWELPATGSDFTTGFVGFGIAVACYIIAALQD